MRKASLLAVLGSACLILAGCSPNESPSNAVSSADPSLITGISLSAPSSLTIGESFTLGVDVLGSDLDSVSLTQTGEGEVSIDGLRITATKLGDVTLRATSTENASIYAEKTISIVGKNASSATLKISGNDLVTYDEKTSYYTVPLGQEFVVSYVLPEGSSNSFRTSYAVSYPSSSQDGNFHLTQNEDGTATCVAYTAYEGISVVFKAYYEENSATPDIVSSVQMHVKDLNAEGKEKAVGLLSSLSDASLISSTVTKSFEEKGEDGEVASSASSSASFKAYKTGSYLAVSSNENGEASVSHYHSTVYEGRHYAFEYLEGGAVQEIVTNEKASTDPYESSYLAYDGGYLKEGIVAHMSRFFDSSSEDSLLLFGDTEVYAYASFAFGDSSFAVTSSYENESSSLYDLSLEVSFDSWGRLASYAFEETMSSEYSSFRYKEEGKSFEYGEKAADLSSEIDMDSYFYSEDDLSYEIATDKDEEGRYDLSNPAKYFAGEGTVEDDGVLTYSLTTSQAIAIRIKRKDGASSLATAAIDTFSMTSSDETMVEPSSMLANAASTDGSGLFIISPYKDVSGSIKEGSADIAIVSQRGYEVTFRLRFHKVSLQSIKVTGPNISDETPSLSLGEIFLGSLSPYFTINGDPDESGYVWELKIIEGPEDGLSLYHYEDGNIDNLYGYAVKGLKVGTYSFKIGCSGSDVLTSNAYSVTVKDSYSAEEIEEGVVGATFTYKMGDSYRYTLSFDTSESLTLTQEITYDSSSLSATLPYSIEKGRIALEEQSLPSGFYYSKIKGDLRFAEDFSSVKAYLGILSSSDGGETGTLTYTSVTFMRYVDKTDPLTYLPGKSFKAQENHNYGAGYANYDYVLSFDAAGNTGSVSIAKHSDSSLLASISFSYSYDSKWSQLNLADIVSTNESVTIVDASPYYNLDTSYGDYIELAFTGTMKVRFAI